MREKKLDWGNMKACATISLAYNFKFDYQNVQIRLVDVRV